MGCYLLSESTAPYIKRQRVEYGALNGWIVYYLTAMYHFQGLFSVEQCDRMTTKRPYPTSR